MNLVELFDNIALQHPQHLAIIGPEEGKVFSYAKFKTVVDETAETLKNLGIQKNQCIGLHCPSGMNYIRLTYAIWRLGACVVPIPTELSAQEKIHVCQGIVLDHILSDLVGKNILSSVFAQPCQHVDECIWIAPAKHFRERPKDFYRINSAFIRFTSGTTGNSKGVVLSHETIRDRIHAANAALNIGNEDKVLWLLSMSYHFAVSIVAYLSFGASIILAKNHFAKSLINTCNIHGITVIYGSPMHYELMANDTGSERIDTLRLAISTTIALNRSTVEAFYLRFGHMLSQALGVIEIGLPCIDKYMRADKCGSVGKVLPAYDLLMDDAGLGNDLRRIKFRGKGFFDAYYDPWRTRDEVMIDGWFDTGDLGALDADGYIFIKGRSKDIINVAGMKFFPQEVEAVIDAFPGVLESCVFSHKHTIFGEVPHAQVVLNTTIKTTVSEQEIKSFLILHLAHYKIPERIEFVITLVRTASGKLVRDENRIQPKESIE